MHPNAKSLIGKKVQKVESTRRGIVKNVRDGSHFLQGMTLIEFEDGSNGLYSDRDISGMLIDGRHFHNTED
jgi:hypothetical protein